MADYLPDERARWLVAVRDDALLMLPAERRDDVAALWPTLGAPDAAARVIDRLAAGGVAATPSFALVVRERAAGTARAVVRGPLTVRLGEVEVSGAQVSTWQERVVGDEPVVRALADDVDGTRSSASAESRLPLLAGVVAACAVEWTADEAPAAASVLAGSAERSGPAPHASAPSPEPARPVEVDRPDERTMVPEDTVVGFSRTERPRIPRGPDLAEAAVSTTVIVPPPGIAADASAAPPAILGDHDGLTVASADIRRLREERVREEASARPADAPAGATALALRLPDGAIEPIVGELVLGRAPAIGRVTGTRMPRPVVIGAGDPDISRTHLRVAVEGGTAVVTDLESRNGTHIVAPGQSPVRLRPAEATPVLPDTVIDLGGGWTIQVVVR
ncbi:FHA domain-containing protein [Agromyces sp. NPDC056523]|uniref:FHA domain-containing protein n=1 Tax=Agromyces sp. NPDC056523 TaxID=3345850 RepID=UPI0036722938